MKNKKQTARNKSKTKVTSQYRVPSLMKLYSTDNTEIQNIMIMMEKLLHWAAIVESSDDAIISKSIDGIITSWNRGAQRLYGYTPDEIIGKPVSVLMPPEKEDDFPFIMNQLREGKRIEHYETKRKTKDGRVLDVSITVSPIRDTAGNIIGASKIARDITERLENERRREEFVSTASHELKTPLTSQKVFGDLLEQLITEKGYKELEPYIKKINAQTNKLTKLIEELLELSRVQTGRMQLANDKFSVDKLIADAIDDIKEISRHKIINKSKTNIIVKGDQDRIEQVLTNLLTNAIKYSPKADKIVVSSKAKDGQVTISVQDFGIGIKKEFHDKIFDRFFRVTGLDEKTYPGMGIGLNFSKEIVERHGGKIWLESEKGKGSTFYFSLPLGD